MTTERSNTPSLLTAGMKLYHGSKDADNVEMSSSHLNDYYARINVNNGLSSGHGYYMTDDYERAVGYGPHVAAYVVKDNFGKPLNPINHDLTPEQVAQLVELSDYWENWDEDKVVGTSVATENLLEDNEDDVDLVSELLNNTGMFEKIMVLIASWGYTYTPEQLNNDEFIIGGFVIYDPSILKLS